MIVSNSFPANAREFGRGKIGIGLILFGAISLIVGAFVVYNWFRVYVPPRHIAVMTKKTGKDLTNDMEIASDSTYKGLQKQFLPEGRYFYDPYNWDWAVYPLLDVPENRMGVRIRLYGDDLKYGEFMSENENQKGIVKDVLRPGGRIATTRL